MKTRFALVSLVLVACAVHARAATALHSSHWAPDPEPTIKTGVTAMTAAVLDLLKPPGTGDKSSGAE